MFNQSTVSMAPKDTQIVVLQVNLNISGDAVMDFNEIEANIGSALLRWMDNGGTLTPEGEDNHTTEITVLHLDTLEP